MKKQKMLSKIVLENLVFLTMILAIGFFLPRLVPGSPILVSQENMHALNESMPQEAFNRFKAYYTPEKSLWEQFFNYLKQIIRLDFGYSFYYGLPVAELILGRLGWTLFLSIASILAASGLGITIGTISAMVKGRFLDFMITIAAIFLEAVPVFLLALLIQLVFSYNLSWFPAQGAYSPGMDFSSEGFFWDVLMHSILPIFVIAISQLPSMIILTRNVIIKSQNEDYVRMARYNNVKPLTIIRRYILRNALPEVISKINIHFVYAVAGALFVEAIFSYPGMGTLLKVAVSSRDYCLTQGIFLVMGFYGVSVNILFSLLSKIINPRLEE